MSDKIRLKFGYDFYKDAGNVPIMEVANALGITPVKGRMSCPCPDHEDKNPSTQISEQRNNWKCYSCGEGGGPLELVVAAREGYSPSQFWELKKTNIAQFLNIRDSAVKFIDTICPGNIVKIKAGSGRVVAKEGVEFPAIPYSFWKNIGISNPFVPYQVKDYYGPNKEEDYKLVQMELDEKEAAEMAILKARDMEAYVRTEPLKIFASYPNIDSSSKVYMMKAAEEKADEIEKVRKLLEKYIEEKYPSDSLAFYAEEVEEELE